MTAHEASSGPGEGHELSNEEATAMSMPDEPRSATDEQVVGVLGRFTRVSGFMGARRKLYTVVVTDRRVIFAELTTERIKQLALEAKAKAQFEGKGLLGRAAAQLHAQDGVTGTYRAMSPDDALHETPTNFAIDRSAIKKVRFKSGYTDTASDSVIIKTAKESYRLEGAVRAHKKEFAALRLP